MTATDQATLYRIKLSKKRGGASWGEWQYYESYDEFVGKLLQFAISVEANGDYRQNRKLWRAYYDWFHAFIKKEDEPVVDSIFAAEKLVDGQWVELKYTLYPPRLEFT